MPMFGAKPNTVPKQNSLLARRGARWPLSVAPMMEWTDRNFRYYMRRMTRRTLLYTEMITAEAIRHGDRAKLLAFDPEESPLVLQLGGSDVELMSEAAAIGVDFGYDEININVGCPSDRVQNGSFGACLMRHPQRVAELVHAMRRRVDVPVTVKHRIGVDELESYDNLRGFVETVAAAGCDRFIVHARVALLSGLSAAENRTIPPLRYPDVYRLKSELPHLTIEINGGIRDFAQAREQLDQVDGVMIGRAAYENPYLFATADQQFYAAGALEADIRANVEDEAETNAARDSSAKSRQQIVEEMIPYVEQKLAQGYKLTYVARHMLSLFYGQPGGRRWRRHLSENAHRPTADASLLREALAMVD